MPKVIKSGVFREKESPYVLQLPNKIDTVVGRDEKDEADFLKSIFDMAKMDKNQDSDDLGKYFAHLAEDEGDTSYSKYFRVGEDPYRTSGEEDSKYFYRAPTEKNEEHKEIENSIPEDDSALKIKELLMEDDFKMTPAEKAEKQAQEILTAARKEAETIRMKLAAEISEAEVKKELAKTIVSGIIEDANEKARSITENAIAQSTHMFEESTSDGYQKGYNAGLTEGRKDGMDKGLAEGRKSGYDDGFAEGNAEGLKNGKAAAYTAVREEMVKELTASTQRAKDILVEAEKERKKIVGSADDQIVKIIMAVVSKILNREIEENPFMILPILKEAAKKVADQPRLFITISPGNYDLVNSAQGDIKKMLGGKQEFTIVSDATLGPADVIIGTGGSGDVDARLETQLNEVKKTIEMVMRQ